MNKKIGANNSELRATTSDIRTNIASQFEANLLNETVRDKGYTAINNLRSTYRDKIDSARKTYADETKAAVDANKVSETAFHNSQLENKIDALTDKTKIQNDIWNYLHDKNKTKREAELSFNVEATKKLLDNFGPYAPKIKELSTRRHELYNEYMKSPSASSTLWKNSP